ncbi:hypothetical protein AgCh_000609 [Apium graveolens]
MTTVTDLKKKQYKTIEDEKMIKLLGRYFRNSEANLPKTQINKDNLDDDAQKKDDQKPSGSNPSQSSKVTGSKEDDKKIDAKKKGNDEKKGDERRRKKEDVRSKRKSNEFMLAPRGMHWIKDFLKSVRTYQSLQDPNPKD